VLVGTGGLSGAAGGNGNGNAKGFGKGVQVDPNSGNPVIIDEAALAPDPTVPGQSVVGNGLVVKGMNIEKSGGANDVVFVTALTAPTSYGANLNGVMNVVNACSIPGGGFADLGDASGGGVNSKKHDYFFSFDYPISKFAIGVLDWGDFLPYGANPDGANTMEMFGYDANGQVVASSTMTFHTTGTNRNDRPSAEYGTITHAGDACDAQTGQPGRFTIQVTGHGIRRVELRFKDKASMDPNIALWAGPMVVTKDGCYNFIALSTDGKKAFDFSGTASVKFCGGGVWSNSGAESSNNSVPSYDTACQKPVFTSAKDWIKPENLTNAGYTVSSQPAIADPLGGVTPPSKPASCNGDLTSGDITIAGTVCYNAIKNGPGDTLNIIGDPTRSDNVLYLDAGPNGGSIKGTFSAKNVLIYVANGDFDLNSQTASILVPNLTNGIWHGFILWVANGKDIRLNGGSGSQWTGTIYGPTSNIVINGGSDAWLRTTTIGKTIDFAGNNNTVTYCDPASNYPASNINP
jgi:hypothetical protein